MGYITDDFYFLVETLWGIRFVCFIVAICIFIKIMNDEKRGNAEQYFFLVLFSLGVFFIPSQEQMYNGKELAVSLGKTETEKEIIHQKFEYMRCQNFVYMFTRTNDDRCK